MSETNLSLLSVLDNLIAQAKREKQKLLDMDFLKSVSFGAPMSESIRGEDPWSALRRTMQAATEEIKDRTIGNDFFHSDNNNSVFDKTVDNAPDENPWGFGAWVDDVVDVPDESNDILTAIEELGCEVVIMPDLGSALIGTVTNCHDNVVAVYDFAKCIKARMDSGLSYEEAVEWHDYNTVRGLMHIDEKVRPIIVNTDPVAIAGMR